MPDAVVVLSLAAARDLNVRAHHIDRGDDGIEARHRYVGHRREVVPWHVHSALNHERVLRGVAHREPAAAVHGEIERAVGAATRRSEFRMGDDRDGHVGQRPSFGRLHAPVKHRGSAWIYRA